MPDRNAAKRRKRNRLKSVGVTNSPDDFSWLCRNTNRIGIVTEGDSWFAYPRRYLLAGPGSNVIDHIVSAIKGKDKANLLRLASNGDEAVQMIAGEQKHELAEILGKNKDYIKLILFSGGGNDVVGKWDMERLLNTYQPGFTAADCVNKTRLNRKMKRVILAYEELIELVREYCPDATVITHTYDHVMPANTGAMFLWGLIRTKPWIYPYLTKKGIPKALHLAVTKILLGRLHDDLITMSNKPGYRNIFKVVPTQGTLRPGHGGDWLNEIHPTSSGFKRITKLVWAEARKIEPGLPAL